MNNDTNTTRWALGERGFEAKKQMPRWRSHKQVQGDKIVEIKQAPADQERQHAGGDWLLLLACGQTVTVGHEAYVQRHKPLVGGYYVLYADGYESYSPAEPFEGGYTRVDGAPPAPAPVGGQ